MSRLDWDKARRDRMMRHSTSSGLHPDDSESVRHIKAKYGGTCRSCNGRIHRGDLILYLPDMQRKVQHERCPG